MDQSVIVGLASAAVAAIASWFVARRATSGNVANTNADRLWDQNQKLLQAYIDDNANLRDRVHDLEAKQHQSALVEDDCNRRNAALEQKVAALEARANGGAQVTTTVKTEATEVRG